MLLLQFNDDGLTGAEIQADIARNTGESHEPSVLGGKIEALIRGVVISATPVNGVVRYKLLDDPRKVIPSPVLERDVAKYCVPS